MCPVCREPLIAFELEGVEIDHCADCRGTWLDAGELEQIVGSASRTAGRLSAAVERSGEGRRTARRCPRCPRRLREVAVGDAPAVPLDRCPAGHGLWFDRGEMHALIAGCSEGEEGEVARFFGDLFNFEESQERGA